MANKTITQLDAAQSLNPSMFIATEVNGNTCKASLAQIKAYCQPSGTINITQGGTYNVADYSEAVVSDAGTTLRVQNLTDTEIVSGKRVWLCPATVYLAWINQDTGSVVYTTNTASVGSNVYTWDNNTLIDTGLVVSNTDEVSYIEIQSDPEGDPMTFQVYPDLNRGNLYKIFEDKRIDFNSLTAITLENIASGSFGDVKTLIEGTGSIAPEKFSKTISANGTYNATRDDNVYSYGEVIVNVPVPAGNIGIPREVKNGIYQMPTENFTFSLPSDVTDVGNYALYGALQNCTSLSNVNLSSLTTISGYYGLSYAFEGCTSLTSVDLSSLTTISGENGLYYTFYNCTGLTNIDLALLSTISGNASLSNAFNGCTGITDIYFRALTTTSFGTYSNQFNYMMNRTGSTVTHTLHFPSNMESTISGLTGYPTFGGTSGYVVCVFDLPATE